MAKTFRDYAMALSPQERYALLSAFAVMGYALRRTSHMPGRQCIHVLRERPDARKIRFHWDKVCRGDDLGRALDAVLSYAKGQEPWPDLEAIAHAGLRKFAGKKDPRRNA